MESTIRVIFLYLEILAMFLGGQLVSGTGNGAVINIEIPDNLTIGHAFYEWNSTDNCTLKFVDECDSVSINNTHLILEKDLLADCSFTGALCRFTCNEDLSMETSVLFTRLSLDIHPMTWNCTYYEFNVSESSGPDYVIYKFPQSDVNRSDCYESNVPLQFSVKPLSDTFEILHENELHLKSGLDYETKRSYNFTIAANLYEKEAFTEVYVNVIDVDDMDPVFYNTYYNLNIIENDTTIVAQCLNTTPPVAATDRDEGDGRQNLTFTIESVTNPSGINSQGIFEIDNTTGCIIVKKVLYWRKNEANQYHITLRATQDNDENRFATSFLTVTIIDVNNHRPKFLKSIYTAVIDEHARTGTYAVQVEASDADEGKFGETRYEIFHPRGLFSIDNMTGIIRVENSTALDRERPGMTFVVLEIRAYDSEAEELGDNTTVNITLNDVNDHSPEFSEKQYIFWILSSDTEQVKATDEDINGNGRVSYNLMTTQIGVHINETNGLITFTNIHQDLEFYVQACDNPQIENSRRCNFVQVIATVNSTGITNLTVKNMSVPENSPINTMVGNIDISGASFAIIDQDIPFHMSNWPSGLVKTSEKLDRETVSNYTFIVTAKSKISSNITINVEVIDVNDNAPACGEVYYVFGLPATDLFVGMVNATDQDSGENANVSYSFQPLYNGDEDYFAIDAMSGNITLLDTTLPSGKTFFQLGVLASDNGEPRLQTICSVYISRVIMKDNHTVSISTPLTKDQLTERKSSLETSIGQILNITVTASVPTTSGRVKRAAETSQTPSDLYLQAIYTNGTKMLSQDLQGRILRHLAEIEALFIVKMSNDKRTSSLHSSATEIALIVVAGVMLLGTLTAVIYLSLKWRKHKGQEKLLRLNANLTRRSSLYESQEIKVKLDDETSDYNGSVNTQDLEPSENGQRPANEFSFNNPVYYKDDGDETKVKSSEAFNEALLSLNDLSDRLNEEDIFAPKVDNEGNALSESQNNSDRTEIAQYQSQSATDDIHLQSTYDTADGINKPYNSQYENINFEDDDDDFPSTSGFTGLNIDGKVISSTGEGHENDIVIGDNKEYGEPDYTSKEEDNIPEDEPDIDYHLKQVRFANRVVNADTNIAEELKPDKSELKEGGNDDEILTDDNDDDNYDNEKVFFVTDTSNKYETEDLAITVDDVNASIRMDEEINSPVDFLQDANGDEEDNGTFVFGVEEITAL